MSKVIDMDGVRSGTAHLKRARELGKARGVRVPRPVPIEEILGGGNVFTVEEVAQLVRLAPITIRRAIRSGALRAANGGAKSGYRITRGDIETWWHSRGGGELFASTPAPTKSNHLAKALNMVQAHDKANPASKLRTAGIDDAATQIRQIREVQTP
jgi:excisionase family DNA binding protein